MADQKLTALTATTSNLVTDIIYVVADPGGTPVSTKMTISDLFGGTSGQCVLPTNSALYLGDPSTNGAWRTRVSAGALVFEKRESGSWVEKGAIT